MTAAENAKSEVTKLENEAQMRRDNIASDTARLEVIELTLKSLKPLAAKAEKSTDSEAKK